MSIKVNKRLFLYVIGLVFFCLILAHQILQLSGRTRLDRDINNALHTPWFYIITCLIWLVMLNQRWLVSRLQKYSFINKILVCGILSVAFAIGTEAIQVFTERDASLSDIFRDLLGAGSAICTITALYIYKKNNVLAPLGFLLLSVILLFAGFTAVAKSIFYIEERAEIIPHLVSLSLNSKVTFEKEERNWQIVSGLNDWPDYENMNLAKITLKNREWPGVYVVEPYPDWDSFKWLNLDVFLEGDSAIPLYIRVRTDRSSGRSSITELNLHVGENHLQVEIEKLIPKYRKDSPEVDMLVISSQRNQAGKVMYIGDIYLE